jgi:hypothetical protein
VRASAFAAEVVVPNLIPTAAITVLLVAARTQLDTDRLGVLLATAALALVVYFASYILFSAGAAERRFYRALGAGTWAALTRSARSEP